MIVFTIETVGDERFVRGMNRYVEDIQDFTEAYELLYLDFLEIEQKNFAAQGTPAPWAALSPNYAKWKAKHAPGRPLLVLRGDMRAALTSRTGASGQIKEINGRARSARFGTSIKIATYHQYGTRRMPRRPVVQLTEEDKRRWSRLIQTWAKKKLEDDLGQGGLLG